MRNDRDRNLRISHWQDKSWRGLLVSWFLPMLVVGCGTGENLDRAGDVVTTALAEWKAGGAPQRLADQGIDIADPDWNARYRLVDFTIEDASEQPQQGPRVVVTLNLLSPKGAKVKREVAYEVIVKSKQKVSIGRDAFHVGK